MNRSLGAVIITVSKRGATGAVLILIAAGCVTERREPIASAVLLSPTASSSRPQPTTPAPLETATAMDEGVVQALAAFARAPGAATFAAVPFAERVRLGLSAQLITERTSLELVRREAWVLRQNLFRGRVGPFSALDLLAQNVPTTTSIGPHPHCASPPVPSPTDLVGSRRVSVQPKDITSCLQWWTVDLFVSPTGRIEAVTLDLWDP